MNSQQTEGDCLKTIEENLRVLHEAKGRECDDSVRLKMMEEILRVLREPVYRYVLRYLANVLSCNPSLDAHDVVQEIFIKVYQGLPRFKGDSSIKTWVLRITTNTCIDVARKKRYSCTGIDTLDQSSYGASLDPVLEEILEEDERRLKLQAINRVLDAMPSCESEAFRLFFLREKTAEVLAAKLGIHSGAFFARARRTSARIRDEYERSVA